MWQSIALFPTVVVLLGCSSSGVEQPQSLPEIPIALFPEPPEAGKVLRIVYNPLAAKAVYSSTTPLEARVHVSEFGLNMRSFELPLERVPNSPLLAATCTLSSRAYLVHVEIAPVESFRSFEQGLTVAVYKDGLPQPGAIPSFALFTDPQAAQQDSLFEYDQELYPQLFWRWLPRWQRMAKSHHQQRLAKEVDSLWRAISPNPGISGAAVCSFGFALLRQWDSLRSCLQRLLWETAQAPLASIPISLVASSLAPLRSLLPLLPEDIVQLAAEYCSRFPDLAETAGWLLSSKLNPTTFPLPPSLRQKLLHGVLSWYVRSTPVQAALSAGDILALVEELLPRDTALAIQALQHALEALETDEHSGQCGSFPKTLRSGWLGSCLYTLGKLLLHRDPVQGIAHLRRLLEEAPRDMLSRGTQSLAAIALGHYYLQQSALDSALKYWVIAEHLRSPFADSLQQALYARARTLRVRLPSPKEARQRYSQHLPQLPEPTVVPIQDRQGNLIELTAATPTLLLFSSKDCGLCKVWYPRLLAEIARRKLEVTVVLLTPDGSSLPNVPPEISLRRADLSPPVEQAFSILGFPTVVVARQGKILYNSGLSSQTQLQTILRLLSGE